MKKTVLFLCFLPLMALLSSCNNSSQEVYDEDEDSATVVKNPYEPQYPVYTRVASATYPDLTNIRIAPSSNAKIIDKLDIEFHGLSCGGTLIAHSGNWDKIETSDGRIGYVYNKYVWEQRWFNGNEKYAIIADKDWTPIYIEDFAGGDYGDFDNYEYGGIFDYVAKGTIILGYGDTDDFIESDRDYKLRTAHDALFVKKSDVKKVRTKDLRLPKDFLTDSN